jgi:hypothetical protein
MEKKSSENDVNLESKETGVRDMADVEKKSETMGKEIQEEDIVDVKGKENKELPIISQDTVEKLPDTQIKEDVRDCCGSQKTYCIDTGLLQPPVIFQDTTEEVPVAQVMEAVEGSNDSQKKECESAEEADKDGSSQETYCSELR